MAVRFEDCVPGARLRIARLHMQYSHTMRTDNRRKPLRGDKVEVLQKLEQAGSPRRGVYLRGIGLDERPLWAHRFDWEDIELDAD